MISPFSRCKMPCQYYSAIWNDIIFIVLPPSYQGSARDAMQTKYIYFNTMIIACCYFYCIAITTLLIVLHCHYPLAIVIAIEHHIFVHRHVRAFLLMSSSAIHAVIESAYHTFEALPFSSSNKFSNAFKTPSFWLPIHSGISSSESNTFGSIRTGPPV